MSYATYTVLKDGQTSGPFTGEEIKQQRLPATTYVQITGSQDWVPISTYPFLTAGSIQSSVTNSFFTLQLPNYLTGSLKKDLAMAALCGMGSTLISFLGHLVHVGPLIAFLYTIGQVFFYWGLFQIGRQYQLRWVAIGAILLIIACIADSIAFYTTGLPSSVCDWLMTLLTAIGSVAAFTDLWGLRPIMDKRLVTTLVIGNLFEVFDFGWQLTTQEVFQLIEAFNVALLAWLFYDVIAQVNQTHYESDKVIQGKP